MHEALLAATTRLVVATGIVNVWTNPAPRVAAARDRLSRAYPCRFLLGLGSSHAPVVEPATGQSYTKPLSKLTGYLDELDANDISNPKYERVLAALGPKALQLAADRSAGAHPYLMPPEHTADARQILGAAPLLATEQKVFLGTDPIQAREVARQTLAIYLGLPNYLRTLRRYGLTDEDFTGPGSDRLVDRLVGWGDADAVRSRVQAHHDAGADHVILQVLSARGPSTLPIDEWRAIADVISLPGT